MCRSGVTFSAEGAATSGRRTGQPLSRMRGASTSFGLAAVTMALLLLPPGGAVTPLGQLADEAEGIMRQAAAQVRAHGQGYAIQVSRTSRRVTGTVGSLRTKTQLRGRASSRQKSVLRSRYTRSRGSKVLTRKGNTGVTAYANGTKVGNISCAAVFTGPTCKEPVWVPQCLSGVFQGASFRGETVHFWTLNQELYDLAPELRGLIPTRPGWRPLSDDDFESVLAALPARDTFDSGRPVGRCALVGSDKGLHRSEMGPYIDGFEVVMRMNGAPTIGYEAQVGSRTTHRFVNNAYVGWREQNETLISKWSGSTQQLVEYSATGTLVINPKFLSYSQSRDFTNSGHLCTQGFRALLLLLHTCQEVEVFGFTGSGGWYYDKQANRRSSDKALHQHPAGSAVAIDEEEDMLGLPRVDTVPDVHPSGSLRRLHSRPGGHKLKVERSCMRRMANLGIFQHHVGLGASSRTTSM